MKIARNDLLQNDDSSPHDSSASPSTSRRLFSAAEVCARLGISRSLLYGLILTGEFPHPIKIGDKVSRWLQSDVESYVLIRTRRRLQDRIPLPMI